MSKTSIVNAITILLVVALSSCTPTIRTKVVGYDNFNGAYLGITPDDLNKKKIKYGDMLSLRLKDTTFIVSYFTGYYGKPGTPLLVNYNNSPRIIFTRSTTGLSLQFLDREGQKVRISMKGKGGAIETQSIMGHSYSNNHAHFASDKIFANAREVQTTGIGAGRLFRSASPFDNKHNRATFASQYIEMQGINTILNLADSKEKATSRTDTPPYSQKMINENRVIFCPLTANYTSKEFYSQLTESLAELSHCPTPYHIHCTEGKDRCGYVCAILEALCGASYDEIVADYIISFDNYFGDSMSPEGKQMFVRDNLNHCLMFYTGAPSSEELHTINLQQAITDKLTEFGMKCEDLERLKTRLK